MKVFFLATFLGLVAAINMDGGRFPKPDASRQDGHDFVNSNDEADGRQFELDSADDKIALKFATSDQGLSLLGIPRCCAKKMSKQERIK